MDAPGELRPRGDRDAPSLAGSDAVGAAAQVRSTLPARRCRAWLPGVLLGELAGAPQVGARRGPSGADALSASEQQLAERLPWWAGEPGAVLARRSCRAVSDAVSERPVRWRRRVGCAGV